MNNVDINVNYNDISLGKRIGSRSYGVVHKAIWQTNDIAVKIIQENSQDSETAKINKERDILREISNLKQFSHRNIVALYGVAKDHDNNICMLFPFADCGSLYNFLHCSDNDVSLFDRINWMNQCAQGVDYLHSNNTVHRDLKTQNLLLFDRYQTLKICDFGTVKQLTTNNTEFIGTIRYMAPELLNAGGKYTEKCDVFSFGIILWEVAYRKKPFEDLKDMHPLAIQKKIIEGLRPDLSNTIAYYETYSIEQTIKRCWDQDPEKRPSMKELAKNIGIDNSLRFAVRYDDIEFERMIFSGSYCDVYKAKYQIEDHPKDIVVKILQKPFSSISLDVQFLAACELHKEFICHENIVKPYAICKTPVNRICMLVEYADCGTLYDFLHLTKHEISFVGKLNWMLQLAKGVEYLAMKDIPISELKTQNLMLCDKYRTLKIGSYGTLKETIMFQRTLDAAVQGQSINDRSGYLTEACKAFWFGIIFWEVLARKKPFDDLSQMNSSVIEKIITDGDLPDINEIDSSNDAWHLKSLIRERCWNVDSTKRPSMKELCLILQIDPRVFSKYPYLLSQCQPLEEIPVEETDEETDDEIDELIKLYSN